MGVRMSCVRKLWLAIVSASALGACSIHPLPKDVTSSDTYAIVMSVRCEARQAVLRTATAYLVYEHDKEIEAVKQGAKARVSDIPTALLSRIVENMEVLVDDRILSRFGRRIRDTLDKYKRAAISLEFALRMTEDNNLAVGTNLLRPFATGFDLIGFNAFNNRTRENFRNFRITETWKELLVDKSNICVDFPLRSPNYLYPIDGGLNLYELIDTYTRLNEKVEFAKPEKGVDDNAFVDVLKFTTAMGGSVDPSFDVTSAARRRVFFVKNAGGGVGADRTDEHQLTVAVYIPDSAGTDAKAVTNRAVVRQNQTRFLFGLDSTTPLRDQFRR